MAVIMNDIVSDLCELPTGVYALEFIPRHEIAEWNGSYPVPERRWYGIGVYRDSLTMDQASVQGLQGVTNSVAVSCLIVSDSEATGNQLHVMQNMQFVLRVMHYDGKQRIVGAPEEYCNLLQTEFSPKEIIGAQGYVLNFAGDFTRKPVVV